MSDTQPYTPEALRAFVTTNWPQDVDKPTLLCWLTDTDGETWPDNFELIKAIGGPRVVRSASLTDLDGSVDEWDDERADPILLGSDEAHGGWDHDAGVVQVTFHFAGASITFTAPAAKAA